MGGFAGGTISASDTKFSTVPNWLGNVQLTTTETDVNTPVPNSGTWSRMVVKVETNSLDVTLTIRSRVNGVNGNQSVTFTSAVTGEAQDTTNTDTLVNLDNINYQFSAPAGTGSATDILWSSQIA